MDDIRAKLGLSEHDTNLGNYMCNLLKSSNVKLLSNNFGIMINSKNECL